MGEPHEPIHDAPDCPSCDALRSEIERLREALRLIAEFPEAWLWKHNPVRHHARTALAQNHGS